MITIKPEDFSSDELYTKMEHLNGLRAQFVPILNKMTTDFESLIKYLEQMKLFKSYTISCNNDQGADFQLSWCNEKKNLFINKTPILECKLNFRIEAHPHLLNLLDYIAGDLRHAN